MFDFLTKKLYPENMRRGKHGKKAGKLFPLPQNTTKKHIKKRAGIEKESVSMSKPIKFSSHGIRTTRFATLLDMLA